MEQLKINCFISTEGDWVHMWKKYLTRKHCQTCQCSDIDIRSFISRHTAYDVSKNWWPLSSSTPPSTRALVIKLLSFRIKASPVDLSGESSHPPHLPVARMTAPLFGCVPKLMYTLLQGRRFVLDIGDRKRLQSAACREVSVCSAMFSQGSSQREHPILCRLETPDKKEWERIVY